MNLSYDDKRDARGVLLRYSAYELANKYAKNALYEIKKTSAYNILSNSFPVKYIDSYYEKIIFESFLPIANQIVIYNHDILHNNGLRNEKLPLEFPCKELLETIWEEQFDFSYLRKKSKSKLHQALKWTKRKKLELFLKSNRLIIKGKLKGNVIAFNFAEGYDLENRSDLFWYIDSNIDPTSVLVYYENQYIVSKFGASQKTFDSFNEHGFHQVKLWEENFVGKKYFQEIINNLTRISYSNEIEMWVLKTALKLCNRLSFWVSFFHKYNVKIHLDPTESGAESIIKRIAINHLNGLSIGKLRSYPPNLNGTFFHYYPNDIFFTWGIDSAERLKNSNPTIGNAIISGYPYYNNSIKESNSNILTDKLKKTNFNILLLDSNHGSNKGLMQFISTEKMTEFYNKILNWVYEDSEIGIIIKPKKSNFINSLDGIKKQISYLEKETDRCYLIRNSFSKRPSSYLRDIDMVVGTSTFLPSSILECVSHGTKAVFYDYSNLRFHESEIYKWGEDHVVFASLNNMIDALKKYKKNVPGFQNIGDWGKIIHNLNPFYNNKDNEQRIGKYIYWLQEAYNSKIDKDKIVKYANTKYAKLWGPDKIIKDGTTAKG